MSTVDCPLWPVAQAIEPDQYSAATPCADVDVAAALCAHRLREIVPSPRGAQQDRGTIHRLLAAVRR